MSEPEITVKKDAGFHTVYADGVILQLGHDNCRLIFYQEQIELEGTENISQKNLTLKFEVRMPRISFTKVCMDAVKASETLNLSANFTRGLPSEDSKQAFFNLNRRIRTALFDSEDTSFTNKSEYFKDQFIRYRDQIKPKQSASEKDERASKPEGGSEEKPQHSSDSQAG